jgi:TP901-1 family phage major tail protein
MMTAQKGSAFLLKISDGAVPTPAYQTVAGLRTTQMSITGDTVVVTSKDSGGWRELLSGAGTRSVSVSAAGIFLGSAAEAQVRANALTGTLDAYELSFEDGEKLRGSFLIQRLDYSGDFNGERNYTMQLESSGAVVPA